MVVVDQKTKNIKHRMGNIEILGRPQYRSRKLQEDEKNLLLEPESKKRLSDPDLKYERDEKDWWWCNDI